MYRWNIVVVLQKLYEGMETGRGTIGLAEHGDVGSFL